MIFIAYYYNVRLCTLYSFVVGSNLAIGLLRFVDGGVVGSRREGGITFRLFNLFSFTKLL